MVDVNTIIGEPIETSNNIVIIPISKVCFGFAAGGSEFKGETLDEYARKEKEEKIQYRLPFGGGSGAGVNINPIAFLVIQEQNVKLLPVKYASAVDKLLDYVPDLIEKANNVLNKTVIEKDVKEDEKQKGEAKNDKVTEKTKPKRNKRVHDVEYDESDIEYEDVVFNDEIDD